VIKEQAQPNQEQEVHIDEVVAGPAGSTSCIIDEDWVPLGSPVSITEESTPNVVNTAVSVSPASRDAGSFVPTANLTIGTGITTANFTNMAYGTIEVCKAAADPSTATQTFQFSVNSGAPISVHAGQCSLPIAVPAGTATVLEAGKSNFHLVNVLAAGPAGETRLVSGTNPVTVSTPFGGVENETVVTFTNAVNTGQFKICKVSSEPTLQGVTFTFISVYELPNAGPVESIAQLTPGTCSQLSANIPVVDPDGNPIDIGVHEESVSGVAVSNIAVQNGTLVSSDPGSGSATLHVNQGFTTITYTNVRTPPVGGCLVVACD
jgi:hypothetical protein